MLVTLQATWRKKVSTTFFLSYKFSTYISSINEHAAEKKIYKSFFTKCTALQALIG